MLRLGTPRETESPNHSRRLIDSICRLLFCLVGIVAFGAMMEAPVRGQQSAQEPAKGAQQDNPVRLKTDLVEIRAVVTDKQGKVISNLGKDDFQLDENGKQQVISFFAEERFDRPAAPAGARPSAPAPHNGLAGKVRRTVVFYVDTIHMANLSLIRLKQAMLKFIDERLGDEDMAAIVTSGGGLGIYGQFTQNKQTLRSAIERLAVSPGSRAGSLYTPYLAAQVEREAPFALAVAMDIIRGEERLPNDPHFDGIVESITKQRAREILTEVTYQRRVTLMTLMAVADQLAKMPGQRLILMASDGFTLQDDSGLTDSDDVQAAISRASRAGIVVYTLAAKGLTGRSLYDASSSARFGVNSETYNRLFEFSSAGDRDLENGMVRIAKGTGGDAYLTTNDLGGAFGKAVDENSDYYALAYYPSGEGDKKSFRAIKIRVKGHPEFTVRTQSGYLASDLEKLNSPAPADPLKNLLKVMGEPLAQTGIMVDASADFVYMPADNAQVSVNVFIDGKQLGYEERDNSFVANPTLLIGILNSSGYTTNVLEDAIQIKLSRQQLQAARDSVYRYTKRLSLKPGLYQLRVGVRDPQTQLLGTAGTWIEVPELKPHKLTLSSLSTAKGRGIVAGKDGKSAPSTVPPNVRNGVNLYRPSDIIVYSERAYKSGLGEQDAGTSVQVAVLQGERLLQQGEWMPMSAFVFNKDKDSVEFGGVIKAADFKAGLYTLRITVKEANSKAVIAKETNFEVVR